MKYLVILAFLIPTSAIAQLVEIKKPTTFPGMLLVPPQGKSCYYDIINNHMIIVGCNIDITIPTKEGVEGASHGKEYY